MERIVLTPGVIDPLAIRRSNRYKVSGWNGWVRHGVPEQFSSWQKRAIQPAFAIFARGGGAQQLHLLDFRGGRSIGIKRCHKRGTAYPGCSGFNIFCAGRAGYTFRPWVGAVVAHPGMLHSPIVFIISPDRRNSQLLYNQPCNGYGPAGIHQMSNRNFNKTMVSSLSLALAQSFWLEVISSPTPSRICRLLILSK